MGDLKSLAKKAKQRLKNGFWEKHRDEITSIKDQVKSEGVSSSKIVEYYQTNVIKEVKPQKSDSELFYTRVKLILDTDGEVSDIIGRLIDVEFYNGLSYDRKQRYVMELSDKYRLALDRYKREKHYD